MNSEKLIGSIVKHWSIVEIQVFFEPFDFLSTSISSRIHHLEYKVAAVFGKYNEDDNAMCMSFQSTRIQICCTYGTIFWARIEALSLT